MTLYECRKCGFITTKARSKCPVCDKTGGTNKGSTPFSRVHSIDDLIGL